MNGKFPSAPSLAQDLVGGIPVSIFRPEDVKIGQKRASSPVYQRAPDQDNLVEEDVEKTRQNINAAYLRFGKPLDMRFAYKVHGAALSPAWDAVWTDDFSSTSDKFRNMTLLGVHRQFSDSIASNLKSSLEALSKEGMSVCLSSFSFFLFLFFFFFYTLNAAEQATLNLPTRTFPKSLTV